MTPTVTSRLTPKKRATTFTTRKPSVPRFPPPLVGPLARRLAIRQPLFSSVFCLAPQRSLLPVISGHPKQSSKPSATKPTFFSTCIPFCNKSCGARISPQSFFVAFSDFA